MMAAVQGMSSAVAPTPFSHHAFQQTFANRDQNFCQDPVHHLASSGCTSSSSLGLYHHISSHISDSGCLTADFQGCDTDESCATSFGACGSVVGQPISALVNSMLSRAPSCASATAAATSPCVRTEFSIAWPPTFPVGAAPEVIGLRAAVSIETGAVFGEGPYDSGGAAAAAAAATMVRAGPGRVLAVHDDVVVGEEVVRVDARGATATARLRLSAPEPGVTSCILADSKGVPLLESFHDVAPLVGLPQAARDEAHRLLWHMMHEALPPNHSVLPFDPDAFRSPLERLPHKLQAALSWAWSHHFRSFAQDFAFLLDSLPPPRDPAAASPEDLEADHDGEEDDPLAHYQSVLAQVVTFLRDNAMFACLATLLQAAVARGLSLVADGPGSFAVSPQPSVTAPAPSPALHVAGRDGGSDGGAAALTSALTALQAAAAARDAEASAGAAPIGVAVVTGNDMPSEPVTPMLSPRSAGTKITAAYPCTTTDAPIAEEEPEPVLSACAPEPAEALYDSSADAVQPAGRWLFFPALRLVLAALLCAVAVTAAAAAAGMVAAAGPSPTAAAPGKAAPLASFWSAGGILELLSAPLFRTWLPSHAASSLALIWVPTVISLVVFMARLARYASGSGGDGSWRPRRRKASSSWASGLTTEEVSLTAAAAATPQDQEDDNCGAVERLDDEGVDACDQGSAGGSGGGGAHGLGGHLAAAVLAGAAVWYAAAAAAAVAAAAPAEAVASASAAAVLALPAIRTPRRSGPPPVTAAGVDGHGRWLAEDGSDGVL